MAKCRSRHSSDASIASDLVICLLYQRLCGSTDFLRKSRREPSPLLHFSARNIETFQPFSVRSAFLAKCWPAAANATVRSRERELRQAGARRVSFRPCLSGLASPESLRGRALECRRRRSGWSVTSSSRLVFSSSSLCCRAIRFFTEYWRGGIRWFLSPRLESARALGWGCGLWR